MSKPSPIDALCERWRAEARSRERLLNPWGYIPTVREMMADELSRLSPLVAAVIEAGKRYRTYAAAAGDDHDAWDAALKAYEEGR